MDTIQLKPPSLALVGDPQAMLDEAKKVADVLVKLVRDRKLSQRFGNKEHLLVEAWESVAHFYGVSAKITTVDDWTDETTGEQGFQAWAEAVHIASGRIISQATAICLNNEDNWSTRPKYEYPNKVKTKVADVLVPRFQLMSMAQTRAISKVLRNVFAFVVVLAGYDSTPAAEMTGTEGNGGRGGNGKPAEAQSDAPKKISEAQRKRLYAIANSKQVPMPEVVKLIAAHGFALSADITVDRYDAIVKNIEAYKT